MIELLNLKATNAPLQGAISNALLRVAHSGRYILGPEVEAFEQEWADYCGVKYCVGTGNALDALRIILMGEGIGPGDEVIVAANTYIATWLAVSLVGAKPVPVDVNPVTRNIDPFRVYEAITPNTAAILATHLYGLPAIMGELNAIGRLKGLLVIADAAQAHGAIYEGKRAGNLCHAEAFSFYPSKNLGALGDGGCITTNDQSLADKAKRLRNYGGVGRLDHSTRGINSRLDEIQAAVLRAKLPYLDEMIVERDERAVSYEMSLKGVTRPHFNGYPSQSNWHQYVIEADDRDGLRERLRLRGIDCHVHYPVPPYLEPAYADLSIPEGSFPVTERLAKEVLSLPIGYDVDVETVAAAVNECMEYA